LRRWIRRVRVESECASYLCVAPRLRVGARRNPYKEKKRLKQSLFFSREVVSNKSLLLLAKND